MKLSDKEWRVLNALWVAPEGLALGAVVDARQQPLLCYERVGEKLYRRSLWCHSLYIE